MAKATNGNDAGHVVEPDISTSWYLTRATPVRAAELAVGVDKLNAQKSAPIAETATELHRVANANTVTTSYDSSGTR